MFETCRSLLFFWTYYLPERLSNRSKWRTKFEKSIELKCSTACKASSINSGLTSAWHLKLEVETGTHGCYVSRVFVEISYSQNGWIFHHSLKQWWSYNRLYVRRIDQRRKLYWWCLGLCTYSGYYNRVIQYCIASVRHKTDLQWGVLTRLQTAFFSKIQCASNDL